MSEMNNKESFWGLISRSKIEIPTIQRDYTYGRKSAQNIREDLLNQILESIKREENLHLDFVYGRFDGKQNLKMLEKNKQSIDSLLDSLKNYAHSLSLNVDYSTQALSTDSSELLNFIPLDGQQRLTTLFLIHWYFAKKSDNKDVLTHLAKFTYSTRNSSKAFFKLLCSNEFKLKEERIVDSIKNHEHFFSFWENDPTVNSAIVVLNSIENISEKLKIDENEAINTLVNSQKIKFDFFDLDDYQLTDELYIKMNARGKKLTQFENFKAWLIKEGSDIITVNNWRNKFDIKWTDLFWNNRPKNVKNIDEYFLQFFKNLFISDYLLSKYNKEDTPKIVNADDVIKELGKIDVLVNAFGVGIIQPILDVDPKKAKNLFDVNVYGTFLVTQSVLRHMASEKKGSVIMYPGILGKAVMKNSSVYSASKYAATGMAKALVDEQRRKNIKFSLLYLGGVATDFWESDEIDMRVQKDKMLTPDEVAKTVYYAVTQPGNSVMNEIVIQPDSHQMV